MISLMLQGALILFVAFVIGLPFGDFLARRLRRWLRRPRTETERVLAMIAYTTPLPAPPPDGLQPQPQAPMSYPVTSFGHITISRPAQRDPEAPV